MGKKKKGNREVAIKEPKEHAKCNLNIPSGSKVKLDGFNRVGVNDKVRMLVTGTVKEIADSAEEWSPGKRMTIHVTKCKVTGPQKKTTIDDAIKASVDKV
jgi:hypothetical protein